MQVGWYLHRLKAMSAAELWHRVRERWRHRSDAAFTHRLGRVPLGAAISGTPSLPARDSAPPALKSTLAGDAARLTSGRWRLFGWREVPMTLPPQWHKDPLGTYTAPATVLAHGLNHRALPERADVRTLWEISRWAEMTRLAMHGWINEDPASVAIAQSWLEDWVEKNPAGYGIHWTSPLEVALRLVNFTWFDALVREGADSAALQRQSRLAEAIVPAHAAWVARYQSFGSSANNHLLGELVGLLHAVRRWPALEPVTGAPRLLWTSIERCILEQFAPDGGNREQALHYHLFAWEMAWHAAAMMGIKEGEAFLRLQRAAGFFAQVVHGEAPWHYGDSDDAEVVPLCLERHRAEAEWQAWLEGRSQGATLGFWLGSPPALSAAVPGWWTAPESGMAVLRTGGWMVRLDASPLGFGSMAAHGHGDALHVSLWDGDLPLLIDPGTGGYYGMQKERTALAAWEAHNGPQPVAGFVTPRRAGAFLLRDHHLPPGLTVHEEEATATLQHEGSLWQRTIGPDGEQGIVITDSVQGASSVLRTRWHFPPGTVIDQRPVQHSFLLRQGVGQWHVRFEGADHCAVTTGLASRHYGKIEVCPVLEVTGQLTLKSVWSRG